MSIGLSPVSIAILIAFLKLFVLVCLSVCLLSDLPFQSLFSCLCCYVYRFFSCRFCYFNRFLSSLFINVYRFVSCWDFHFCRLIFCRFCHVYRDVLLLVLPRLLQEPFYLFHNGTFRSLISTVIWWMAVSWTIIYMSYFYIIYLSACFNHLH